MNPIPVASNPVAPVLHARPPASAAEVHRWIVDWVAAKLEVPVAEIDPNVPLIELGLDSLAALELSGRLEVISQREVSPLIVREYPTIAAISAFLAEPLHVPPSDHMPESLEDRPT